MVESIVVIAVCTATVFNKEIQGHISRAAIWLKVKAPANKFKVLVANQQLIFNSVEAAKKAADERAEKQVEQHGAVLENIALVRALVHELGGRIPANQAGGLEELMAIKADTEVSRATVIDISNKLMSPETEQLNATYMASLGQLAKAADATLGRQERIEKLLEAIVTKLNNSLPG